MSPRIALSIATSLALTVLPATASSAKPTQAKRPVLTAPEGHSIVKAATGLGRINATTSLGLARDRKVDVRRLRSVRVARKSALKRPRAVIDSNKTVDARVLLLAGTGNEPTFTWWKSMLAVEGVPFDAIVTRDADPLTAATLRNSDTSGRYQAVVLATGSLTDCSVSPCADTMGADGWAALQAYEKDFAVREIAGYGWPSPVYGTDWGGDCGDKSSITLTVTPTGAATFADLTGTFPTDKAVWGCETKPLAGSSWQTLVAGAKGAVVGTFLRADGVETMFNSIDGSDWTIHSKLLFNGMLKWVTKGVYLGAHRSYLGIDIDDVFLGNDRWNSQTNTLNPDPATVIRMKPADVQRAATWQKASGVTLNMLFNGAGGADIPVRKNKTTPDPLTSAFVQLRSSFRWTSHTFTHDNLDASTQTALENEVRNNIAFAKAKGFAINPAELTTGQHSGLSNPNMAQALANTGVKSIGADASRGRDQAPLGSALTVPRHPTGVYYNVGTKAEQLDEYNYLNYEQCGGPGCLSAPADWNTYVANEATMIVRHMLGNDPRPHYVHQSNLAEEGTLYPVADEALRRYRSYVRTPIVQLSQSEAGMALQQQAAWKAAVAAGQVSATISATGMTINNTVANLAVPVSGTTAGTLYGGLKSGWQTLAAGTTQLGL